MRPSQRLDQLFRQCLANMSLLSWGTTTSWSPSSPSTAEAQGGKRPPGELHPPQEGLKEAFYSTDNLRKKLEIYVKAKEIEEECTRVRAPGLTSESPEERLQTILKRGEGWDVREVARAFRTSVKEIRKIRYDSGRDPETGIPQKSLEVQNLFKSGVPIREIARLVDQPYSNIYRYVKTLN